MPNDNLKRCQNVMLYAVVVLAAVASGYFVLKARAGLAPGAQTLTYSGFVSGPGETYAGGLLHSVFYGHML